MDDNRWVFIEHRPPQNPICYNHGGSLHGYRTVAQTFS